MGENLCYCADSNENETEAPATTTEATTTEAPATTTAPQTTTKYTTKDCTQTTQPQSSQLRIPHLRQLVESAMLVVKNAKLSLATTRQLSILIACLVEETPCSHGGHATTTSASANDAEM